MKYGYRPCLWPGCRRPVSRKPFWGCASHWYTLPEELRTEISRAGERGTPTYTAATDKAREWIAGIPERIRSMNVTGGIHVDSDPSSR